MAETLLELHGPHEDLTAMSATFLTPVVLGLLLNWAMRLPRWGAVAVVAPFVDGLLRLAGFGLVDVMDLGVWQGAAIFMMIGASGNVAAVSMVGPGDRPLRAAAGGAVAVAFLGVASHHALIEETAQQRRLEASGIPLVVAAVQDHELTSVADWSDGLSVTPAIALVYDRPAARFSGWSQVEIYVMPATAATPEAACRAPRPLFTGSFDGECRMVAPGVWARREARAIRVFAVRENGLVQVASETVPERGLVAVLGTFRHVTAAELAARA
jgi:hypothetical protein